ncbi:MAG: hypothetical protein AB8F95_11235, partial [Bacteroidia bacterium]
SMFELQRSDTFRGPLLWSGNTDEIHRLPTKCSSGALLPLATASNKRCVFAWKSTCSKNLS